MTLDRIDALTRSLAAHPSRHGLLTVAASGLLGRLWLTEPAAGKRKKKKRKKKNKKGKQSQSGGSTLALPPVPPTCLGTAESILTGCGLDNARCCSNNCNPIPSYCVPGVSGRPCHTSDDCAAPLTCTGYRCG